MIGVFAEDVADYDGGFLDYVGDFRRDEFEEGGDAESCGGFDFNGEFPDRSDGFSDEMDVDFGGVFAEFGQDFFDVGFVGEHEDEFEFGDFDVDGVVVFAEEDADVVAEDFGAALEDEEGVSQGEVLDLGAFGEEGDEGWGEFGAEGCNGLFGGDVIHEVEHYADAGEYHRGVGVGEAGSDAFGEHLCFLGVLGNVGGESFEDVCLAPSGCCQYRDEEIVGDVLTLSSLVGFGQSC